MSYGYGPLNQLPTDPNWARLVHVLTTEAAIELDAMVIMIVMQDGGKLSFSVDGVPDTGPLAYMAMDYPTLLEMLAALLRRQAALDRAETRQ